MLQQECGVIEFDYSTNHKTSQVVPDAVAAVDERRVFMVESWAALNYGYGVLDEKSFLNLLTFIKKM